MFVECVVTRQIGKLYRLLGKEFLCTYDDEELSRSRKGNVDSLKLLYKFGIEAMILRVSYHGYDDNISLIALEIINGADNELLIILARKSFVLLSFSALLDKTCLIPICTDNTNARS